jgi:gamma-glutamylcyclotransferase
MKKLYFAYGANLNHAAMRDRCPAAVPIQPFYLKDYRLIFSGVATVQPCAGALVAGGLWSITETCEQSLDRFEGYPMLYRKCTVEHEGQDIMFYVMNYDDPCEPDVRYLNAIAQGYQDFGLPLVDLGQAVITTRQEQHAVVEWTTAMSTPLNECAD